MALPLLNLAAVPFTFGSNQMTPTSIAARRQIRRLGGSIQCRSDVDTTFENLDSNRRAIIAVIVNEAAKEIQSVMGLRTLDRPEVDPVPAQPPNSPSNEPQTFEFPMPRLNRCDGLLPRRNLETELSSEEDELARTEKPKRSRSIRKRRRVPSFKTGTQPRVPAKVVCGGNGSSEEADDELSEPETSSTLEVVAPEQKEELELRLNLLSETRRNDVEEWARVGTELRNIADSFQKGLDEDGDEAGASDLFSLINLMLPVSVPQSLWSALFSYAAWKIFKRFQ